MIRRIRLYDYYRYLISLHTHTHIHISKFTFYADSISISRDMNNEKRVSFSLCDALVPSYSWLFPICVLRRIRRMISCRLFGV